MASRAAALLVGLAWLVGLAHAASPPAMPAGRIVAAFTGCRPSTVASRSGSGSAPPPAPLGPDARALVLAVSGGPPPRGPEHTAVCRFLTSEGLGALKRAMADAHGSSSVGAPPMPAEDDGAVTGLDTASIINATAALTALVDGPGAGANRRTRAGAAAAAGLVAEVPAWPLTPPPGAASSLAWLTCTRPSRVPADEAAPVLVWRPALTRQEEEEEEEEGGEGEPALPVLVALPSGPAAPFAASAAAAAPPAGTGSGGTLVAVSGPFLGALATAGGGGAACVFGRKSAGTSLPLHPSGDDGGSWDAACEAPPWDLRSSPGGRPAMAVRVRLALTAPGGCAAPVVVATDATDPPPPPQKQRPPPFAFTYVPDPAPSAVAPAALARDNAAAGVDLSVFLDRRPAPWGAATPKEGGKAAAELPTPSSDAEAEAAMASAFPTPLIRLVGAGDREADVDLAAAWSAGGRALVARLPPSLSLRTRRCAVALSLDGQRFAVGDGSVTVDVGGPDVSPSPSLVVLGEGDAAATAWTAAFNLAGPASAALPPGGAAAAVSAALYGWPGPGPAPAVHVTPPTLTWGGGESTGRAPPGPRRAAVAVSLAGGAPLCRTCVVLVTAVPGRGLPPPLPGTPPAQVALAGPGLSRAAFRRVARLVSPPLTLSRPPPPPGGREQPPSTPPPALKVELAGPPSLAPLLPITLAFDLIPRAGDAAPFFGGAAVRAGGAVRWFATLDPPPSPAPLAGNNSTLLLVPLPLPPIDWAAVPPSAGAALDVRLVRSWAVRPLADGGGGGGAGGAGPHLTLSGVRPGECPPGWAAAGAGQAAAAVEADDASFDGSAARPVEAGGGGGGGPTPSPAAAAAGLRVLALQAAPPGAAVPLPITLSGMDDAAGAGNGAPLSPSASLEVGATVPAGVGTAVLCLAPAAPGAAVVVVDDEGSPLVPGPPGEDGGPPAVPATAAAGLAAVVTATTGGGPGVADARVSGRRKLAASPPAAAWCEGVSGTPWTLPLVPGQNEFGVVVTPAGAPRAWRPAGLAAAAHAAAARALGGWGWVAGRSGSPSSDAAAAAAATTTPPPPPTLWLTVVRLAEEGHARLAELAAAAVVPGSHGPAAAAATAQPQPRPGAPSPLPHTLLLCSDTDPTARACSPAEPLLLTLPAGAESVRLVPRLAARGVAGVTLEVGGRVVGGDRRDEEGRQPPEAGLVGVRSLRPGQRAHVPIVVTAEDGVTAAVYALALEWEEEAGWGGNGTTLGAAGAWSTAATPALTPTTTTPALTPTTITPARCARCPAGRAAPAVDSPSCGLCPPGTAAAGPAAPACTPCPPGHFSRGWGADRCAPCVPGSHAPAPGARLCAPCPPNTTALAPGAARCADPARRTVDPDATPALLISFELVLTGAPALSDLPRRVGVDGTPAAVLGRLVAADTAAALRCGPGDVSVSPVVARARRVLAVNVTAALAQAPAADGAVPPAPAPPGPAPGPEVLEEEDPASAAAALASLSADAPMALLASDPDAFFGRTTAALGAHAAPSAERPPTAVASVPPAVGAAARRRRLGIGAGCLMGAAAVSGCAWAVAVAARRARRAPRGRRATTAGTASPPAAPPSPPSSSPPVSARRLLVGGPASDE